MNYKTLICALFLTFPGAKSAFLILSALPDGLVGAKSAFPIPFDPLKPYSKAPPGAKSPFLSPQTLPDGFAGSNSAFLSPQPLSDATCLGFVKFTCNGVSC